MPRNPEIRDAIQAHGFDALSFHGPRARLQYEAAAFFLEHSEVGYRVRGIDGVNELRDAADPETYTQLANAETVHLSTALNMLETVRALRTDVDRYYYLHEPEQARAYLAFYEYFNDDHQNHLDGHASSVIEAIPDEE